MAETSKIQFIPRVYEKGSLDVVVDRSFTEFGQTTVVEEKSLDQFFREYEELYFRIPIQGATGSHQYLVEKSSELYKTENTLTDIQPLLDEITMLRSQSVVDQQTIIDLRTQLANNVTGSNIN